MLVLFLKYGKNAIKYVENWIRIYNLRRRGAIIGNNVVIGKRSKIDNPKQLRIGDNVYIGEDFYANCIGGLEIGDGTIISNKCIIITYNHKYDNVTLLPYGLENELRKVSVGDNCWIGIDSNICGGVNIGNNAIIGMGTTVSREVPDNCIYVGTRILNKKRTSCNQKHSLLEVRTIYNPFRFLVFCVKINRLSKLYKTERLPFSTIKEHVKYVDYLSLLYQYGQFHDIHIDYSEEFVLL